MAIYCGNELFADVTPTGVILPYAGTTPPNYLLCDGAEVSRTTYAKLFSVIGTAYGSGDGSTTFNVPNMSNIVTNVDTNVPVKGNGMTIGLTNGTNNYGMTSQDTYYTTGTLTGDVAVYGRGIASSGGGANITKTSIMGLTTDPTKSGIVGTVTRSQIACRYIIKC